MHVLNGGRMYILPKQRCHTFGQQLAGCLEQLMQFSLKEHVYMVNFFAGTTSAEHYRELKRQIEQLVKVSFDVPVLCNFISQQPLSCRVVAEVFYSGEALWKQEACCAESGAAMCFTRDEARVMIGRVQVDESGTCGENATLAFQSVAGLLSGAGFALHTVVRQWNYIENILGNESGKQRYQEFNNIRSLSYGSHFEAKGFPAATGIGMKHGGIIIEFLAVDAPEAVNVPLDNPRQIAAHSYSPGVLSGEGRLPKATPKFERARYLGLFGQKQLFISGTASIHGEQTMGAGNPEEQTRITIENIQRLYADMNIRRIAGEHLQPAYGHARVYLKNRNDYPVVKRTFKTYYGNLPVVYLIADVCREELLVEIEGKVILEEN